jgi:EXPERA (EXPanded EBP superfamily)
VNVPFSYQGDLVNRKIDLVFAALFAVLFLGWLASDMPAHLGLMDPSTGWYAREIDPIFRDPPSWLRTSGWFGFAFGPLYAAAVYGFIRCSSWLLYIVLPLAGMVVAMTGLYLIEDVTGNVRPLHWAVFYLLNAPYIAVPVLAALWLFARESAMRRRDTAVISSTEGST